MKSYEEITTIEEFWSKFEKETLDGMGKDQLEMVRVIFFTACSGIYTMIKSNLFNREGDIRLKIEFMKALEAEIRQFSSDLVTDKFKRIKH